MTSDISEVDSFKTAEAGEDERLLEAWNLTLPGLLFLMLTISYLELLKLPRNCLCFWLPCQKTYTSFPITSQSNAWSWGEGLRGSTEKWQSKLDCHQQRTFKKHGGQSDFDQPLLWENLEGDRNIICIVLLACTCTKNWFLEYITTITCRSTYWTSVHASGLGVAANIWYYLTTEMSPRVCT